MICIRRYNWDIYKLIILRFDMLVDLFLFLKIAIKIEVFSNVTLKLICLRCFFLKVFPFKNWFNLLIKILIGFSNKNLRTLSGRRLPQRRISSELWQSCRSFVFFLFVSLCVYIFLVFTSMMFFCVYTIFVSLVTALCFLPPKNIHSHSYFVYVCEW